MITKLRALFLPDDSVVPYLKVTGSPFYKYPGETACCTRISLEPWNYTILLLRSEFQITYKGLLRDLSLFHNKRI
jgi:hypothetical protein